jgi:hypothetical protein
MPIGAAFWLAILGIGSIIARPIYQVLEFIGSWTRGRKR